MRVSDASSYRNLIDNLNMINTRLEQASNQVSSGKRLNHPHDSPSAAAEMVQLGDRLAQLDQYQTNADQSAYLLQVSETALNSVYDLVSAVYARGSEAASGLADTQSRNTIMTEIRSQRDQILTLANTDVRGRFVFSGSQSGAPAFSITGDTAQYEGDDLVNTIEISNGLTVKANIPGSTAFASVFQKIESLLSAIQSGDTDAMRSALSTFKDAMSQVSQVRAALGVDLAKIQDSAEVRQSQQTSIKGRQGHIADADMAQAITDLSQAQTALQASLTAGAMLKKTNLFDFLA